MSRGFVKEDDLEHAGTDVPERPVSTHANYVTPNGYQQLESLAAQLEKQRQDLSGKKDDQTALQQLAVINRDLRYVASRLESALIIQPDKTQAQADSQIVVFGAIVTVEDEAGDHEDDRREAEREARDQAERVVDRRADVPVRGGEERVDAQHALEAM